jgi:glycosyltransferase involved in cell wall biosynthesis
VTHKFSIVIPVYNRREYLRQAIASCLKQTAREFEKIVSDEEPLNLEKALRSATEIMANDS